MQWFDGHLDLAYLAMQGRDLTKPPETCGGRGGDLQPASVTFPSLRAGNVAAAIATIFLQRRSGDANGAHCFENVEEAFMIAMRQVEIYRQWEREGWVENAKRKTKGNGKDTTRALQIVLALEGAVGLRRVSDMDAFYDAGVRMVSLAWAEGSKWSGGNGSGGDITAEGRALVRRLEELGCVHDVTHLSERAFWSLMELAKGPVVASHSNCRALLPGAGSPDRHLSDEQIRALTARGGLIGINLFAKFLLPAEELKRRRATAADVVRHIQHMEDVVGRRDFLALGTDMDGGFGADQLPSDLEGPSHLQRLADVLAQAGWGDLEIERFAWRWGEIFDIQTRLASSS